MDLFAEFRAHLATLPIRSGRALVAVSGGPDSVALLDLLHRNADLHGLDLVVAHLDHGIHPDSAAVAGQVAALARGMELACETGVLALGPEAGETGAREARYAWLRAQASRLGANQIFTAHHADDQVETVLMRVLGGSGPAGLSGMAAVSGAIVRPLLPFRREALVRYVGERGLPVWLDPANQDPVHLRSWLRTEVLPALRRRLPEVDARLGRLGVQAGRDREAWDRVIELLPGLDPRTEAEGISVAGHSLRAYDSALAETVLIAAARRAGCRLGPARARQVLGLLHQSASGREIPLGSGWRAELAFDRLRLARTSADALDPPLALAGQEGLVAWGGWRIRWRPDPAPERQDRGALTAWFSPDRLTVRAWAAGERVRPLAGSGRRLVVRCFQDARVPRRKREGWPVLAASQSVVWIPGVCRSDALLPAPGSEALRVDAELA